MTYVASVSICFALIACGNSGPADLGGTDRVKAVDGNVSSDGRTGSDTEANGRSDAGVPTREGNASSDAAPPRGRTEGDFDSAVPQSSDCFNPPSGIVVSGGGSVRPRPNGSLWRFQLVYQGRTLRITRGTGVDAASRPSDGPLQAGKDGGYWAELWDGAAQVLYTERIPDPTALEGVSGDGGFTNSVAPFCDPKVMLVDVPNFAAGRVLVVFASEYGTQLPSKELARFLIP